MVMNSSVLLFVLAVLIDHCLPLLHMPMPPLEP